MISLISNKLNKVAFKLVNKSPVEGTGRYEHSLNNLASDFDDGMTAMLEAKVITASQPDDDPYVEKFDNIVKKGSSELYFEMHKAAGTDKPTSIADTGVPGPNGEPGKKSWIEVARHAAKMLDKKEEAEKEALLDANGKGGLYELHRAVYTTKHAPEESRDMCELAITGKLTEVKALLAQGVSPESTDGSGHTALSDAACGGHDDIVELLLALGADPNTASHPRPGSKRHLQAKGPVTPSESLSVTDIRSFSVKLAV